jgi:uncharacterized membrane protein
MLWYFWVYSFLGYLLEKGFATATHAEKQGRKCFLLLPLCPVYGLGMLAVLALPPMWTQGPWLVVSGGLAATVVEYAVHWLYETSLGVRFWDYSQLPGNLHGRVCLPFSFVWGLLTALAVRWVQPVVAVLTGQIPPLVTYLCLLVFTADAVASAWVLLLTGDTEALRGFPAR